MEKENKGSEPIKTALEKAMEKVDQMEAPSEEELLEWKWVPKGKQMAAQYLQGACDLPEVISNTEETGRDQFVKGILETLLENIRLPRSEQEYKTNELAMEGLKSIKNDEVPTPGPLSGRTGSEPAAGLTSLNGSVGGNS